ncbi:alcohol dehydrogenase catalytic domain-containing protein [Ornithinibacillus sp. L9]|uniref:Alcohol dehydrogenase catalytic domain-containing protein n=1 Tax=Ornithinibacillus caprae TaxID=2678566 RepID=A0A6N8FD17_9BACI|nr:alcohol dehydrogenase catalytic domain-containing protein [Ornithinibacillus caprae]MUK87562.1 alcohol dehydrogenase catalytic domain-containing protein [Ornithinibacillus caprae]
MKVLSWNGPKQIDVEERPIPQLKENEVLVKVDVVGICGSEIEGFLGHNSLRVPPLVMGHEFSGHIEELGAEVNSLNMGSKVVVNPLLTCGTCKQCVRGNGPLCENRQIIGIHRSGGFAEYVAVPASSIVEVPEKFDSYAATLSEPLACCFRAVRRAMAQHTVPNVLIYGAGAIGLLSSFVAKEIGANNIIVADINEDRLQTLSDIGIEHALNNGNPDFEEKLEGIVGNKGVDVVIDAVGFLPTRSQSAKLVNPGGVIMNIGLGIDETPVPINHFIRSEITVLGSFCYSRQDFWDAVQLLVESKVTPDGWTEVRTLEEGQQSFMELIEGKVKNSKIFLDLKK